MKYLKYVILLSLFVICSCDSNAFIGRVEINPMIDTVASDVTVTYKLGDLLILDVWGNSKLNNAQLLHLVNGEPESFILTVKAGNFYGVRFYYVVDGSIKVKTNPAGIGWEIISNHIDDFDFVTWTTKRGVTISEKNQVPVVNKENTPKGKPESKGSSL